GSTLDAPLQKSAATVVRINGEIGSPSTIGRLAGYQMAAGPAVRKVPLASRIERPVRNGTGSQLTCASLSVSGSGTSTLRSSTAGGSSRSILQIFRTLARTTSVPS